MSIALVAGLGNPGREYAPTRHNLGWIVLEALAHKHGLAWRAQSAFDAEIARWDLAPGRTCWLAKPLTFMNLSGDSVGPALRFFKLPLNAVVVTPVPVTVAVWPIWLAPTPCAKLIEMVSPTFAPT